MPDCTTSGMPDCTTSDYTSSEVNTEVHIPTRQEFEKVELDTSIPSQSCETSGTSETSSVSGSSRLKYLLGGFLLSSLFWGALGFGLAKAPEYVEKLPLSFSTNILTQRARAIAFFADGRPVAINFGITTKLNCPLKAYFDYAVLSMDVTCVPPGSKDGVDLVLTQKEPLSRYDFSTIEKSDIETPPSTSVDPKTNSEVDSGSKK